MQRFKRQWRIEEKSILLLPLPQISKVSDIITDIDVP
jgi:hypothetical protein